VDHQTGQPDETAGVVDLAYRKLEQDVKGKAGKRSRTLARFAALTLPADSNVQAGAANEQVKGQFAPASTFALPSRSLPSGP
jgi:hypothetical protein